MLFDLRGRGRRRTVQVVYVTLALLMGGGLVLFGIGGDVQGGLFDAFSQNQGSVSDQTKKRVEDAEKATQARPQDADAWRNRAEAQYQLAGQSEGFNDQTGEFTGKARTQLEKVEQSWNRHVALSNGKPNADLAATMRG